jgi:hypothetical protein
VYLKIHLKVKLYIKVKIETALFLDKTKRGIKMKVCKEIERRRRILEQADKLKEKKGLN